MCDICNGHSGCPVCSKEPYYVECPYCCGVGYFYYTEEGDYITRDALDVIIERCEKCDGEGEIIDNDDRLE